MAEELKPWEYRVLTIGGIFGTKDEDIEAVLNEWGAEGWEATQVYTPSGSGKVTLVAKRVLTSAARRQRSMPKYGFDIPQT
jgi:Domain of unknown function (DUF4177)